MKLHPSTLIPHPLNVREHPERSIRAIANSLRDHGQLRPVIINTKNVILSGHGLVEAAKLLGMAEIECQVIDVDEPSQLRWMVADNRTAQLSRWKPGRLREVLESAGRQTDLFTADEINSIDRVQPLPRDEGSTEQPTKSWMHRRAKPTDTKAALIGDIEMRVDRTLADEFAAKVKMKAAELDEPVMAVARRMLEEWLRTL